MVGHQAKCKYLHRGTLLGRHQQVGERQVVPRLAKNASEPIPAVEHMIHRAARSGPCGSRLRPKAYFQPLQISIKVDVTFSCSDQSG